jgi:hypothetical protein
MIKLPVNSQWTQPNNSDKFGSVWATKNIDFDEEGYLKLSPRMVRVMDDSENGDFGFPVAIGRHTMGGFQVATASDANFSVDITEQQNTWTEDSGTAEPTLTFDSNAVWFQGLWHASTATAVFSKASPASNATWTSRITSLTSGVQHKLCVFASRVSLCVSNGNVVKQYNSSYSGTTDLTIPSDFEIVGMAYNNERMGIITRLANDGTDGQDQEAQFITWTGATTGATSTFGIGSDAAVSIVAYKSSFVILTRAGELLYFNGGGFQRLAALPFFYESVTWGDVQANNVLGDSPMVVEGDVIYIHLALELNDFGKREERMLPNTPAGIWCFDPKVGLYHKWSPSISTAYVNFVDGSNVNTSTDEFTVTAGVFGAETIPATGGIARLTETAGIGGLTINEDYYIIKTSSTTFKLAETRELALTGIAIDITSASSGSNFFWMYDLVDYGTSYYSAAGALGFTGDNSPVYDTILAGARLYSTSLSNIDLMSMGVPFLENRGWMISPKIFPESVTDTIQKLYLKFRPLDDNDSFIVKFRGKEVIGLPVSSSGLSATWTGANEFYTLQNLAAAKTYLDAGGDIECEIVAGAGGGVMSQVSSIVEEDGTYAVVLADNVLGVSAGLKSEFIMNNWKVFETITSETKTASDGFAEVPVSSPGKFTQFKVELRGNPCLEEMQIITTSQIKSV